MVERGRSPDLRQPGLSIGPFESTRRVAGAWRAGLVVWETTRLSRQKVDMVRALDEVWTPSEWGRRLLADNGVDEGRVRVVPEGVDTEVFRTVPRARLGGEPFRFLCVGRWTLHKGVDDLVAAYCAEFGPDEPVELVLHCWCPYQPGFDLRTRIARAAPRPHAPIVASMPLPVAGLAALYNRCDAFVLATRGEGWGLPIFEAMACGLPAIITDYSAPAEYMDESIAYPLRVERMIDVDEPFFFERGAGQWAQPDVAHLRALMRHVVENREEAFAKGQRAAEAVRRRWTWDHAAATAYALLEDKIRS
jgi:glycosyltransferase involved in cell wall biosynthesis